MSTGSGFIAAAVAALVVSVSAAGFLAVRRTHTSEAVSSPAVSADPAPAPLVSPEPATSPTPNASPVVVESQPAVKPVKKDTAVVKKTPAPVRPAAPRTRTTKSAAPAAAPARSTPMPSLEPVVEAPPLPPPPPVSYPPVDPQPSTTPAPVVEAPPAETQKPRFEELTVKTDSVVGIRIDQSLSSATAKVEDRVTARVSRDVTVDGRTVLPTGTKLEGTVMLVEPGSKFKGRARLGIRFHTIVLADGQRVPIQTEALYRDGESATGSTAAKVGTGAAAGAILGAVIGGKRGAIIGAGVGAGGGTAAAAAGDRKEAVLTNGTALTMRLTNPVTITIERDPSIR